MNRRNWMLFVDGENITIRAQKLAEKRSSSFQPGPYFDPDTFIWLPDFPPRDYMIGTGPLPLEEKAIRAYYYTSVAGDDKRLVNVRNALWDLGFSPQVFKKGRKDEKAKGVDIALAQDFLSHAFYSNYEIAVLVAGDGDYVTLVEEVKRMGKVVYVQFFGTAGLSPELRLASDYFFDMEKSFFAQWGKYNQQVGAQKK